MQRPQGRCSAGAMIARFGVPCAAPFAGAGFTCSISEDFAVPAGEMRIVGPLPGHARTCVSGQTCAFGGIVGADLGQGDRMMLLDTCGIPRPVVSAASALLAQTGGESGATEPRGERAVGSVSGGPARYW